MPRRPRIHIDPTRAASRTIAVTSAGDLQQLETDFLADKSVKDTKIANLEDDKNDKDTRVQALELSAVGIVDGGRADVQHLEATDIDGGSASI